ncbi:hypothetical protein [Kiloniella antarctica]|uniref:Uncharacterized protein n=1 Tax=Kiloniella antarctica TaxID=1550907 RepID=A0ABW5BGF9_9PROT
MQRTGYVRDTYKTSDRKTGLLSLTLLLVTLLSISTVSVSLAAILSPEKFLADRMVDPNNTGQKISTINKN